MRNMNRLLIGTMFLTGFSIYTDILSKDNVSVAYAHESQEESIQEGFISYYFKDKNFYNFSFIKTGDNSQKFNKHSNGNLSCKQLGRIKIPESGNYVFSTDNNTNIKVTVNNKVVIDKGNTTSKILLEKDKIYDISIESNDLTSTKAENNLYWSFNEKNKAVIPDSNKLTPDFSKDLKISNNEQDDPDKDGIPSILETNGYTFKDYMIVPWEESYNNSNLKKFVSNPNEKYTVGDPYSDFEKATKYYPRATNSVVQDPLVAAYPSVGVAMERFHFSKNENVSEGASGTKSKSVTRTTTNTNTAEIGGEISFSPLSLVKVTPKYSHSWSTSTATQESDSTTWSQQINLNTADAAYVNANVRYYNSGTAPIYKVKPTTNFVLKNAEKTLATITAGPNQIGEVLAPGQTYPQKEYAPIALDRINEAGTMRIPLNKDELDAIQSNSEEMALETIQNSGQYARKVEDGGEITTADMQWSIYRSSVQASAGSIIINEGLGKEILERWVAAPKDSNDSTPVLTIKEAIMRALEAKTDSNGKIYYNNSKNQKTYIDESAVTIITDESTKKDLETQLKDSNINSIYEATWHRNMKITLNLPAYYSDFENEPIGWEGINQPYGYTGNKKIDVAPNDTKKSTYKMELKPYTYYTVKAYVKNSKGSSSIKFYVSNQEKSNSDQLYSINDKWQPIETVIFTGAHPEKYTNIFVQASSNAYLHVDDVAVFEWKSDKKPLNFHSKSSWYENFAYSESNVKLNEVVFKDYNTDIQYDYKVVVNGIDKGTQPRDGAPKNGELTINLKKYNNGSGFPKNSNIDVYAIDIKTKNEYLVASRKNGDTIGNKEIKQAHTFNKWATWTTSNGNKLAYGVNFNAISNKSTYDQIKHYKVLVNGANLKTREKPNFDPNNLTFLRFAYDGDKLDLYPNGLLEVWAEESNGRVTKVLQRWYTP